MKQEDKKQHEQTERMHKSSLVFCYKIGESNILINHDIEVEILTTSKTYKIPHTPQWYRGMTSLRGAIFPVVNMHFLLGMKLNNKSHKSHKSHTSHLAKKQSLLRLKHPDFPALVIITDGLPYQTDISELAMHTVPNANQYPNWIKSTAKYNNHLYLFADYRHLFHALQHNNQEQLVMSN
jgi:chemotaxis signal transduction protein